MSEDCVKRWKMMVAESWDRYETTMPLTAECIDGICEYGSVRAIKRLANSIGYDEVYASLIIKGRFDVLDKVYGPSPNKHMMITEAFITFLGIGYKITDEGLKEVTEYNEEVFARFMCYLIRVYPSGFQKLHQRGTHVILKIIREYPVVIVQKEWPYIPPRGVEYGRVNINRLHVVIDAIIDAISYTTDITVVDKLIFVSPLLYDSVDRMAELCNKIVAKNNFVILNHIYRTYLKKVAWRDVIWKGCECTNPSIIKLLFSMARYANQTDRFCSSIISKNNVVGLETIAKRWAPQKHPTDKCYHEIFDYIFVCRVVELGFIAYYDHNIKISINDFITEINNENMPFMEYMDEFIVFRNGRWVARKDIQNVRQSIIIAGCRRRLKRMSINQVALVDVSIICMA